MASVPSGFSIVGPSMKESLCGSSIWGMRDPSGLNESGLRKGGTVWVLYRFSPTLENECSVWANTDGASMESTRDL